MPRSVFRSIISSWGGMVCVAIFGLLIPPIIVRGVGKSDYGLLTLLVTLANQFILFDLGVRNALVKFIAETKDDKHAQTKILSSAALLLSALGILGFFVCAPLLYWLPAWLNVDQQSWTVCYLIAFVLLCDGALEVAFGFGNGALAGRERYDVLNLLNVSRLLLTALVIFVGIQQGGGILSVVLAHVSCKLFFRAGLMQALKKELPEVKIAWGEFRVATTRLLLRSGFWIFIFALSTRLVYQMDAVVIGIFLNPTAVATYAAALMLIDQLRLFAQNGAAVLAPRFSAELGSGKGQSRTLILKWIRYSQLISIGLGIPFFISGSNFIKLWLGPAFADSGLILHYLALPFFFIMPSMVFSSLALGIGAQSKLARLSSVEGISNLTLSILLVNVLGVSGVALGTVIPSILISGILLPLSMLKFADISLKEYVTQGFVQNFVPALISVVTLLTWELTIGSTTWLTFIGENMLGVCILGIYVLKFYVTPEDRAYILRRLGRGV